MSDNNNKKDIPTLYPVIKNHYELRKKIGAGSFGTIFLAEHNKTNEKVAIKFEPISKQRNMNTLTKEANIQYSIHKKQFKGFPKIIYFNKDNDYKIQIMSKLGRNLQKIFDKYKNCFKLETVLSIGVQIVERLICLHSLGQIHRDQKPENICVGAGDCCGTLCLIDFGLSKYYIDESGTHIPIKEKKGLVGTIRYTSKNSHMSIEQSRRDDLESLGYILVYLLKGKLPWQGVMIFEEEKRLKKITELKCHVKLEELCSGCPEFILNYFKYVQELKFSDTPDYNLILNLFKNCAKENKLNYKKLKLEWAPKEERKSPNTDNSNSQSNISVTSQNNLNVKNKNCKNNLRRKSDQNKQTYLSSLMK